MDAIVNFKTPAALSRTAIAFICMALWTHNLHAFDFVTPIKLTFSNSSPPMYRPSIRYLYTESDFLNKGYYGYPIDYLRVLSTYCHGGCSADYPLSRQSVSEDAARGFHLVVNGTFFCYKWDCGDSLPLGPIIRDGQFVANLEPKAAKRGVVAILNDGTLIVDRAQGTERNNIIARFNNPGNPPLQSLMGGGAMLIENGTAVSVEDIVGEQKFCCGLKDGLCCNLYNGPFRSNVNHTVIGIKDGQGYVLVNINNKSGADVQKDLLDMRFQSAVMFDGGGGFYFRHYKGTPFRNKDNPTGFGIFIRKY